ncbi:hypothetical protein ACFVH0_18300, partial [Streptomyces sp. NPDC127117]
AKWAKDKLMGMPKEADDLFQEARKLYVAKMQTVISSVADIIGAELGRAKARIAKGRAELKAEVGKLPADLRQFGQEAATDFAGKFDDLEATVNEKSEQLVQDLAQKYTAALNKVDEEIKKLQEANKGLVDKAKDAIVGVIKTINELKNLLLGILAKAASAIMKIIKDPIGFLGNLVKAVGAGLQLFVTNIAQHLRTGVVSWLLGTAVKAGLELPQRFDLRGIIQLIGSLLGLTWDNIRARITRKGIPDQAMTAVESSVPVAKKLAAEGPAGAVKEIESEAGDLKATILEKLTSYLIPTVIIAGITWIISLLNPASAFVRAVKGIIDIVTFIVNQGAQIVEFVNAVLDAVIAIANGGSAGVPKMVETALAASVPLLIGFLASLLGIGSLANKVKSVFHAVARPVNRAIDKIVNFIAKKGKALWDKLKGKDKGKNSSSRNADPDHDKKVAAGLAAIDVEEQKYLKDGKISPDDAKKVARKVKNEHSIFKSITVIDGGGTWDYSYVASKGRKKGEEKGERKSWELAPGGLRSHEGKTILTSTGKEKTVHLYTRHGGNVTNAFLKERLDAEIQSFLDLRTQRIEAQEAVIEVNRDQLNKLNESEYPTKPAKQAKRAQDYEKIMKGIREAQERIVELRGMDANDKAVVKKALESWRKGQLPVVRATRFKNDGVLERSVMQALRVRQRDIDNKFYGAGDGPIPAEDQFRFKAPLFRNIGVGYELNDKNEAVRMDVYLRNIFVAIVVSNATQRHYMVETAFPEP